MKIKDLFEAPLPDDWDKSKFQRGKTSFKEMVAYAKERAVQIGRGSSRVAFEIPYQGRSTVLKVALSGNKGISQNREEAALLDDRYVKSIGNVIPLIDYDEANGNNITWIHTEKAQKITQKQLERFFEGVPMWQVTAHLDYARTGRGRYVEIPEKLEENENFQMLQDLVLNFNMPAGDLARKANWGLYKGSPVIIDLGYTEETRKLYM